MSNRPPTTQDLSDITVNVPAEFIRQMSVATSLQQTLDTISQWLCNIVPIHRASVTLYEEKNRSELRLFSLSGKPNAIPRYTSIPLKNSHVGTTFLSKETAVIHNLAHSTMVDGKALFKSGINNCISTPIKSGHYCYGTLNIGHEQAGFYNDTHALVLRCIADWIASHIRIYREVERSDKLANTDHLTGLLNRRSFMRQIREKFNAYQQGHTDFAVAMLDIDHFKTINDSYGHDAGDKVLQGLARKLTEYVSKRDLVARIGGEEFIILFDHIDLDEFAQLANYCQQKMTDITVLLNAAPLSFTTSIGLTYAQDNDQNVDDIIKRADKLMYTAKNNGRHQLRHSSCLVPEANLL